MTRRGWCFLLTLLGLWLGQAAPASAQTYSFRVPQMKLEVTVRPDASATLRYEIVFANEGSPIDVVDIGLPHDNYDLATMKASIDGEPLISIRKSTYVETGVEVQLGSDAIPTGKSGTFVFECVVPDIVFNDTTDDSQASFRITPTWFDPNLVVGNTELTIGVYLPRGLDAQRVRHHNLHKSAAYRVAVHDGQALVAWRFPATRVTQAHLVGVSFPREVMTRVVVVTKFELLLRWWEAAGAVRLGAFIVLFIVMGIAFFRFSGGTGWSVFFLTAAATGWLFYAFPRIHFFSLPLWLLLPLWMERTLRRARTQYLPPIASVEGGGVKRGLTAPEAAVVLERPLGHVLTLVIFGLLKKGLLEQAQGPGPLRVKVPKDLDTKLESAMRRAAAKRNVVLHRYEPAFLLAIRRAKGEYVDPRLVKLEPAMKALIKHVAERLEGFDLEATRDYYRRTVDRAWQSASAVGELTLRTQEVDKQLEWLLLDDGYTRRFGAWETAGFHYHPRWTRAQGPSAGAWGGSAGKSGGSGTTGAPTAGDVGASFAGWAENVSSRFVDSLSPTALKPQSGVINLSGADKTTGDILSALMSNSGGGGGGGSSCACAGCACACACAGGGR